MLLTVSSTGSVLPPEVTSSFLPGSLWREKEEERQGRRRRSWKRPALPLEVTSSAMSLRSLLDTTFLVQVQMMVSWTQTASPVGKPHRGWAGVNQWGEEVTHLRTLSCNQEIRVPILLPMTTVQALLLLLHSFTNILKHPPCTRHWGQRRQSSQPGGSHPTATLLSRCRGAFIR
jgi:hypothetical protein